MLVTEILGTRAFVPGYDESPKQSLGTPIWTFLAGSLAVAVGYWASLEKGLYGSLQGTILPAGRSTIPRRIGSHRHRSKYCILRARAIRRGIWEESNIGSVGSGCSHVSCWMRRRNIWSILQPSFRVFPSDHRRFWKPWQFRHKRYFQHEHHFRHKRYFQHEHHF